MITKLVFGNAYYLKSQTNFTNTFSWTVFNCLKEVTKPLRGDSLLFTTKPLGVPRTHLINLGQMKSWCDERMKVSGLEPGPPELGIHHSNH